MAKTDVWENGKKISSMDTHRAQEMVKKGKLKPHSLLEGAVERTVMTVSNFTKYFEAEKDVYIQNVSNGNVSLQFGSGDQVVTFSLQRKRDPINLTNHVPFDLIKKSMDFRKIINRPIPVVKLLSEEEYAEWYQTRAAQEGVSIDEAISKAETARIEARTKVLGDTMPSTAAAAADSDETEDAGTHAASEEDLVNPRCLYLTHQGSNAIPKDQRMAAPELLQELKDLEEELTVEDFDYVISHISYDTVKKWAKAAQKTAAEVSRYRK